MTFWETNFAVLLGALLLDAAIGYPQWLVDRIGHPVTWIGRAISILERRLNGDTKARSKTKGVVALCVLLIVVAAAAVLLQEIFDRFDLGWVLTAVVAGTLIAQRSLNDHVAAVATALSGDGIDAGRLEVSKIVGRDPSDLDEAGIVRASIESLAENFSDGVVAPAFWLAVGGLPGIVLYKAINTADSMIGHRSDRYAKFGWAAARLDDLVNWPAARLSAAILIIAAAMTPGARAEKAMRVAFRDHDKHRSPNAGWPEATMAGALGIRLSGPRTYDASISEEPWIGDGQALATSGDIARALRLFRTGCGLLLVVTGLVCAALISL